MTKALTWTLRLGYQGQGSSECKRESPGWCSRQAPQKPGLGRENHEPKGYLSSFSVSASLLRCFLLTDAVPVLLMVSAFPSPLFTGGSSVIPTLMLPLGVTTSCLLPSGPLGSNLGQDLSGSAHFFFFKSGS